MPDWLVLLIGLVAVVVVARLVLRLVWRWRLLVGAALVVAALSHYGPGLPG